MMLLSPSNMPPGTTLVQHTTSTMWNAPLKTGGTQPGDIVFDVSENDT